MRIEICSCDSGSFRLLISESTASPNDRKLTRATSTCKETAEQIQKLVTTERIHEDDSPKEKVVKKIHEAGNCELQEVQQRTDKVQCQRCYSYRLDFKYVHAEES